MLYLASSSPRRRAILAAAGFEFTVCRPGFEVEGHGDPRARAMQRAESKARGADAPTSATVLGVDTVVECEGVELGKPSDRDDARRMLTVLAGRDHEVHSAHCVIRAGVARIGMASACVRCAPLERARLEHYLAGDEWRDKAGAYGIQGAAGGFMTLLAGELDTVIGLSVATLRALLAEAACHRPN